MGVTRRGQGELEGWVASLLEAERREAQVQGNPSQVSCGGVLGCTGSWALSACVAASHPHVPPTRPEGSSHPLVGTADRPDH